MAALAVVVAFPLVVAWLPAVSQADHVQSPQAAAPNPVAVAGAVRRRALEAQRRAAPPGRDTHNVALDDSLVELPVAAGAGDAWLAVDGDPSTAWKAEDGPGPWVWTLPFSRPIHLGLIRTYAGDNATVGVPSAWRWDYLPADRGRCAAASDSSWTPVPNGAFDDRDPNEWVYGPRSVHAQKRALFANVDACGLRLNVLATDGGHGPVLREISVYQGARSITLDADTKATASSSDRAGGSRSSGAVDGTYERYWRGVMGQGPWTLQVDLAHPHDVDRLSFVLGSDATQVSHADRPGHAYSVAWYPKRYIVETRKSPDAPWERLHEADPPARGDTLIPVRRRLVRLHQHRIVQAVRLVIDEATDPFGRSWGPASAPEVREIGIYETSDPRPVLTEPVFLSVDVNPSALTHRWRDWGRADDSSFARDFAHRLRRIVEGFDADSAWPADAHRRRDASAGRFHERIEADDPQLDEALLGAQSPPPVVLLSGGGGWEFGDATSDPSTPPGKFRWNPVAKAGERNRGIGQLAPAVRDRVAPFIGFCGGEENLALLAARSAFGDLNCDDRACPAHQALIDAVLARNNNELIRGPEADPKWDERAFWADKPAQDAARPTVHFLPSDPLFSTLGAGAGRNSTRQLPMLHGDMVRSSAFSAILSDFAVAAWTDYCHPWVNRSGPEPTWPDPDDPDSACVRIPHAFHSKDADRMPIIGFQFHADGKDLPRLAPGAPPDSAGDALNSFANAIDMVIDGYLRAYWPHA